MRRSVRLWRTIIIVIMVAGFVELMAYARSCQLVKYSIGFTPLYITESYESYLGRHHPRLGWLPSPDHFDAAGSRPVPAFPDPMHTRACASLYGDSFTEGAGVNPEHAWSNILSEFLHCRLANYGVSGYGTDQAYLRFLDNSSDQAKVVILGFLSENLMRNVNQLRNLIDSTSTACPLKPRFVLNEQGELALVPIPRLTENEYNALREDPGRILAEEFFYLAAPRVPKRGRFLIRGESSRPFLFCGGLYCGTAPFILIFINPVILPRPCRSLWGSWRIFAGRPGNGGSSR